jgi:uncharacterized membrane protein
MEEGQPMEMNGTIVIGRPVDVVFDYVIDLSNDANWRTRVDESGWQPGESLGVGAMGYTLAGGQKAEWRVISYIAGERADWEFTSGPLKGRGGYRFVPVDGGTRFTLVADVEPTGWLKLLGPIFTWIGRRQNQRDVEKLRDILESTADRDSQS